MTMTQGKKRTDPMTPERLAEIRALAEEYNFAPAYTAIRDLLESYDALTKAGRQAMAVAEEARQEWDKAPSGMRAGKLLIALSGGLRGYRPDIDAIQDAFGTPPSEGTVRE